jgi:MFS family permease
LSGAFGGLIAFGLIRIETGSLVGWQYLYIVEGSLSIMAGPLCYFWIPRELPKAWFYSAEERLASAKRADALVKGNQHTDKFSWAEVFKGLTAWQVSLAQSCGGVSSSFQAVSSGVTQFATNLSLNAMTTFM